MTTSYVSITKFLPEVLPYVRDCPEIAAINAIRNAAIEFCAESLIWRYEADGISLEDGVAEYAIGYPLQSEVVTIVAANLGTKPLMPRNEEELAQILGADWRTKEGPVQYVMHDDPNLVRVAWVPDQNYTDQLKLIVALQPSRTATTLPKFLLDRWVEEIAMGAKARLHDTPAQPYYDLDAALRFRVWFKSAYGKAKIVANRGHGRTTLRVRPPSVF